MIITLTDLVFGFALGYVLGDLILSFVSLSISFLMFKMGFSNDS